jgi:hypothetical protein
MIRGSSHDPPQSRINQSINQDQHASHEAKLPTTNEGCFQFTLASVFNIKNSAAAIWVV